MENSRKIWYDQNDQPPKNYIWYKNGQYLEWIDGRWKPSEGMNNSNSGSGISEDMTEEQKIEARKNLGLYYEETSVGEKIAECQEHDYDIHRPPYIKISDDTPTKNDIVALLTGDGTELEFALNGTETSYNVTFYDGLYTPFYVTEGDGIYYDSDRIGDNNFKLVYNGSVNVIHKIDAKFLPEQEQESVILDITAPLESGEYINVETLYGLSAKDMTNIYNGKILALCYPITGDTRSGIYVLNGCGKDPDNNPSYASFLSDNGKQIMFNGYGGNTLQSIYISPQQTVKPIILSALPTAQSTFADLVSLGLTWNEINAAVNGLRTGIQFHDLIGYDNLVQIEKARKNGANAEIVFNAQAKKYEILLDDMDETAIVTITPLS